MTDDRISAYLHQRAATIDLPPASAATVVRRARRRRVRRGAALGAAVVTVAASAVAVTRGGDGGPAEVSVAGSAVAPTTLDWSVVEPTAPLGMLIPAAHASTDDGTVYSLSTEPGVPDPTSSDPLQTALYRSDDGGADWAPVDLPGDFSAASLATAGSQLYAVGTSPAGGGVEYRLATSGDGGATWSSTSLPAEVATMLATYPDETYASEPSVAVSGDTVVVSTSVGFNIDVRAHIPGIGTDQSITLTEDGAVVGPWDCSEVPDPGPGATTATTIGSPPAAPPVTAPPVEPPPTTVTPACVEDAAAQARTYTWEEIGIDDEARDLALAGGRTFVYVSQGGGEFTPVDIGAGAGSSSQVVAADEGFTLLATASSWPAVTHTLTSPDGVTWAAAGDLEGMVHSVGVVGGRAAVAMTDETLDTTVHLTQPDGSWLAVDPADAVEEADIMSVDQVAFGPLGWAAIVRTGTEGVEEQTVQAVHSLDGTTMSLVPLGDVIDVPTRVSMQPAVTADAVLVRVKDLGQGPAARQQVVVGTPAG